MTTHLELERQALPNRARAIVEGARDLAQQCRLADAQADLDAILDRFADPMSSVVVVGEASVGKTSLINALLEREGLLPVDHRVATNVPVVIRHGEPEGVRVWFADGTSPEVAALGELDRWATVSGSRERRRQGDARLVGGLDVTLENELLAQQLAILDTPGTGGLVAAHAQITLEALSRADGMLFVLDAKAPASEQELDFLEQAAARVGAIIVVLTKTERPRADWETILRENERLIGDRLGALASRILPISSPTATAAIKLRNDGDETGARMLEEASGFVALRAALEQRIVSRGRLLRLGSALQMTGAILERCRAGLEAERVALSDNDEASRQLAGVESLLDHDAAWRARLARAVDRLRDRLVAEEQERRTTRLYEPYRERVHSGDVGRIEELIADLERELVATHAALGRVFEGELSSLFRTLQRAFGEHELGDLVGDLAAPSGLRERLQPAGSPQPLFEFSESFDNAILGAVSLGAGVSTVLGGPTAAGGAMALLTGGTGTASAGAVAGATALLTPAFAAAAVVGAVFFGFQLYRSYKEGHIKRAGQALERAVNVSQTEILGAYLTLAAGLNDSIEELVDDRTRQRDQELRTRVDHDGGARLAEIDRSLATTSQLQDERARLRSDLAAALRVA